MVNISKRKLKPKLQKEIIEQLVHYVSKVRGTVETREFLFEFLTESERVQLGKRLTAVMMLIAGYSFTQIEDALKVSPATVVKYWKQMKDGTFVQMRALAIVYGRTLKSRTAVESLLRLLTHGLPPRAGKGRWDFINRPDLT